MGLLDHDGPRAPTWDELDLDSHLKRLKVSLIAYLLLLAAAWALILEALSLPHYLANGVFYLSLANYVVMTWSAYRIQETLHEAGLYGHGGWHVWAGALVLNPCFLGWWIPVSVLSTALRTRSELGSRPTESEP